MKIAPEAFVRWRRGIADRPLANRVYRLAVGVVGIVVLSVGIVTIPYPGPGWLLVFTGLGILASEFYWAKRVLGFVRVRYDAFMAWFRRQGWSVQLAGLVFTSAVVVTTLWVLGAFALMAGWVGVHWDWLASPLA